jgi:alginate O-acetyltransferase complex protein AlgI
MWLIAGAIFFGCKALTWHNALGSSRASAAKAFSYFCLWPGMDPRPFLRTPSSFVPAVKFDDWAFPLGNVVAGATLLALAARALPASLLAGWFGMVGFVLVIHFGAFGLLGLCWRAAGVPLQPIMRAPILARSLAEFWGTRWNTAFSTLARGFVLRPLAPRLGIGWAMFCVYLVSGALHEAVISVPARAGFGLPTAYFILQGLASLAERSDWGRRAGLGRGMPGRCFTLAVVAGPAFWLFHPAFVRNVFLPMLRLEVAG